MRVLTRAARCLPKVAAVPSRCHRELTRLFEDGCTFTQRSIERAFIV